MSKPGGPVASPLDVAGRRVLVVSPHYDDVPLALGQSLMDGVLSGAQRVDVRVVFGRSNWAVQLHPTRKRAPVVTAWRRVEEELAARRFGYRVRAANLEEAILRTGTMDPDSFRPADTERPSDTGRTDGPSWSGGSDPTPDPLVQRTVELMSGWMDGSDVMWVPAGLGRHIDHRIVARAGVHLVATGDRAIAFYEDRPYTAYLDAGEVADQLGFLGLGVERHEVSGPITEVPQRWVRRIYRSQMSEYFVRAQAQDRAVGGAEAVWVPAGRLQEVTAR